MTIPAVNNNAFVSLINCPYSNITISFHVGMLKGEYLVDGKWLITKTSLVFGAAYVSGLFNIQNNKPNKN